MKKVVRGKTYNTKTAILVAASCRIVGARGDHRVGLWQTQRGGYFCIHESFNKAGMWVVTLWPLSDDEATEWRRDEGLVVEAA